MSDHNDAFPYENGKFVTSYLQKWKRQLLKILYADFNYHSYYLYQISLSLVDPKAGFGNLNF